jgi:hypothetical protein
MSRRAFEDRIVQRRDIVSEYPNAVINDKE